MINSKTIGKIIQQFRTNKKLTQEELAEKIEISPHYLSKVERGLSKLNVETFLKMASVLNFKLEDFGINIKYSENELKNRIINKILSSNDVENYKYLKAINFIDDITK